MRALDEIQPSVVLIESPADTGAALAWVGRPGLVPPVALLGYVVAQPERAVFAPLATFSPEWQAASWAGANDVPIAAIDLPLAWSLAPEHADEPGVFDTGPSVDPLAALAEAAGEPDAERWWDDLIEHRGDGLEAFGAVGAAMAAVRRGTVTAAAQERREAHMRREIRRALAATDGVVAVVCGAWHVPALDPGSVTASVDTRTLRGHPKVKVAVTWVPWTSRRLGRAGYGAGVTSPGWYDHVFRHPGPEGVTRFFVDAAQLLRERGMSASPDHVIGASRLATSLAAMRQRPRAGLAEVLDAADAVMGGLTVVRDELVVGDTIGEVPAEAPQVPLARDLAAAAKSARLPMNASAKKIELDLRTPNGARRSRLLHRLRALGVEWGTLTEGRGSSGTFRETWEVRWEPELSVRLVERAGDGTTVVGAATARLVDRVRGADVLADASHAVDLALLADLPAALGPAVAALGRLAAAAPDVAELMDGLRPLAAALRYGDVRGTDAGGLVVVFDELVVRILAGLDRAAVGLDDEAARAMIERLSAVQAALGVVDHPARVGGFPPVLMRLADGRRVHGLVQGRATRLLHDGGGWPADLVEARLGRALSPGTPAAAGAAFVEGFLAGSGTVLVHDDQLLGALDAWLASLPADVFDEVVPLLRRTFGAFEPAERRQLGRLLATGTIVRASVAGDDLDPGRVDLGLATVRRLLGLPVPHDAR
ncbi:MAG: DUF5682 family protein [Desertimonas sp.]